MLFKHSEHNILLVLKIIFLFSCNSEFSVISIFSSFEYFIISFKFSNFKKSPFFLHISQKCLSSFFIIESSISSNDISSIFSGFSFSDNDSNLISGGSLFLPRNLLLFSFLFEDSSIFKIL